MEYKTMKQCIKEKYDTLSMQEKKVAKYIIDNYQQSILLSSAELAQQSGVSNTAVIRFARQKKLTTSTIPNITNSDA